MNIMVLDTETAGSMNKPFCYNFGYTIYDTNKQEIIQKKDYVIEQIWHNMALFNTAYYAEKRPIYVSAMRGKTMKLRKFGVIMKKVSNDIKKYNIKAIYAFNSAFDDRVIQFNCDWFRKNNPLGIIPIYDIRPLSLQFVYDESYKEFCEKNELFTETGNYSTTAETIYKFITNNSDFVEAHTALNDAIIETEILAHCVNKGAEILKEYAMPKINREKKTQYQIKVNGKIIHQGEYVKKFTKNNTYNFTE